jgi:hypothetical protein
MDIPRLPVPDRAMLVSTAHALAVSGHSTATEALALVERFRGERDYVVWTCLLELLAAVGSVFGEGLRYAACWVSVLCKGSWESGRPL